MTPNLSQYRFGRALKREVGRTRGTPWDSSEFTHIARVHCWYEDFLAHLARRVLFCDTDAFTTALFHEAYLGRPAEGLTLAGGISAALLHRERTGEALPVDGSLLSQGAWSLGATLAGAAAFGMARGPRYKPSDAPNAMVNSYQTSDGRFVFLVMLQTDRFWPKLVTAFGKPGLADDPRFADHAARMKNTKEAVAELAALFAARSYDEAVQLLNSTGGAWAPVQRPIDVLSDPQIMANGYVKDLTDANGTPFKLVPAPLQFNGESGTPTRAPGHGEHTDELLGELGLDMDKIIELKISGAVL